MPFPGADAKMEMKAFGRARLCQAAPIYAPHRSARQSLALPGRSSRSRLAAFTLLELLVVIMIIAALMGLAFPVFQGVQNQGRKAQARNDLVQIVTAISAYYTEYGKYPLTPGTPADTTYGTTTANAQLFNELRNVAATQNPRGIVFLSPPDVKDASNPRAGISSASGTAGQYFDPWGKPYLIRIDTDYDNQVSNPYSQNAGGAPLLRTGVIAWSFGKDALSQSISATPSDKNAGTNKDDIISWQ
jgi:prepilin-type N-terminal cleavage/methylation domain-containing protein